MKNVCKLLTLAALLLCFAAIPALCAAQVFAPDVEVGDTLPRFDGRRGVLGVSASDKALFQARIAGRSINVHVYSENGDPLLFDEELSRLSQTSREIRLSLRVGTDEQEPLLQIDQAAVDFLQKFEITQIVVADREFTVLARYNVADIQTLRKVLGLADDEQLCLSGETNPVTIVSADGIRRQIAQ